MALILTLDINDILRIGDIDVKYIKKSGRKICLSIKADKDIKISRIKPISTDSAFEHKSDHARNNSKTT